MAEQTLDAAGRERDRSEGRAPKLTAGGNERAQKVDRWMLDRVWVPVGQGVKKQEEVDALAIYLFDDEQGEEELLEIDARIGKLPGLAGIKLMSKALYSARERTRKNPRWAHRLIENEEWAIKPAKRSPVGELTTRRTSATEEAEDSLSPSGTGVG